MATYYVRATGGSDTWPFDTMAKAIHTFYDFFTALADHSVTLGPSDIVEVRSTVTESASYGAFEMGGCTMRGNNSHIDSIYLGVNNWFENIGVLRNLHIWTDDDTSGGLIIIDCQDMKYCRIGFVGNPSQTCDLFIHGNYGNNCIITNNLFYCDGVGYGDVLISTDFSGDVDHIIVENNTFVRTTDVNFSIYGNKTVNKVYIRNNIITENDVTTYGGITFSNTLSGGHVISDFQHKNNIILQSDSNPTYSYTDHSVPVSPDSSEIEGDPLFIGSGIEPYRLQNSSPARHTGYHFTDSPTDDLVKNIRPNPPSMGALEDYVPHIIYYLNAGSFTQDGLTPDTGFHNLGLLLQNIVLERGNIVELVDNGVIVEDPDFYLSLGGFTLIIRSYSGNTNKPQWTLSNSFYLYTTSEDDVVEIYDIHFVSIALVGLNLAFHNYTTLSQSKFERCIFDRTEFDINCSISSGITFDTKVSNCIFINCSLTYTDGFSCYWNTSVTAKLSFTNNVFYDNKINITFFSISSIYQIVILNNIFISNGSGYCVLTYINWLDNPDFSSSLIDYNCTFDFIEDFYEFYSPHVFPLPIGSHNLRGVDPLFVNGPLGDFHLRDYSPCINTGIGYNTYASVPLVDFDGDTRTHDFTEMGVYILSYVFQDCLLGSAENIDYGTFINCAMSDPPIVGGTLTDCQTDWSQPTAPVWDSERSNFSNSILAAGTLTPPQPGNAPYTGYEKGLWDSVRTGIGAVDFVAPPVDIDYRYWVASSSEIFDSTDNWSLSSGGSPGASVPDTTNVMVFDSGGQGDCSCNVPVHVKGLRTVAGYNGTIFQREYAIIVDSSDASFNGGIFDGSSAPIIINGSLHIGSMDFTSTSDVLTLYGQFHSSIGNFSHNNGTFRAMTTSELSAFNPNGTRFYDLMIDNDRTPAGYRLIDSTSTVENQLTLSGGYLRCGTDGTLNVLGDVSCSQNYGIWLNDVNVQINFTSGGFQNIITSGGILPHITVDKTTQHPVKFFGDTPMYVDGDFFIIDGTVNTNGVFLQVGAP